MFDLSSFELQKSIMNYNKKQMMEAELAATKAHKRFLESSIDALVFEYDRTYNTESSKVIERKFLKENAVISVVKNSLYGIFESALLLDESVKAEYQENIKTLFETYFYQVLKENNVKTLGEFKKFAKNANSIIENVIERAETLVSMNEAVYTEMLETTFNSTSLDNVLVNTLQYVGEADVAMNDKVAKARQAVDQVGAEFQRFTLEQKFASAHKLIQTAILILRISVTMDHAIYAIVDKFLSIVHSVFGKEGRSSLREKLLQKTIAEVDSYYATAIDVAITLKKIQKNYPENSKEYLKIGDRVVSIYKAIITINNYRQELINRQQQTKALTEMSFVEFMTESDSVADQPIQHDDIVVGLKQRINACMVDLDAYQGLENLKLANRIVGDPGYRQAFVANGNGGTNVTLLIIKALKLPNLPDKVRGQYIKEARAYKANLDSAVAEARRSGRADQIATMIKQGTRLESFLNQYEIKGAGKMMRESISPLLSDDYKVGMDILASNILEAAQFFELYEATAEDVKYVIGMVNEADACDEDVNSDLPAMVRTMRENVDESTDVAVRDQSAVLEAAVYKKLYMADPQGIHEAAGKELAQGKYPKLNDFLDDDDKKLIDSVVSATGKDKVVEVVKSKVIGVIEAEEKRLEDLEAEEQKLLSKLSKKIPEGGEALQEAVQRGTGRVNTPTTLFEAIVMNRSKKYIQEATALGTGFDIISQKETIMAETVTLYTIHETFNTLQFPKYESSKINKLTQDYYNNKI